jgi:hypothetical protein
MMKSLRLAVNVMFMIENVITAVLRLVPKLLSFLMTKYFVRTVVPKVMANETHDF